MKQIRRTVHRDWSRAVGACLAPLLLTLFSCAQLAPKKGEDVPPARPAMERETFRSDRYLVCVPGGATTAAELAEQYLGGPERAWMIEEANGGASFSANDAVVIPLRDENPGGLESDGYQTVPILCYHRFGKKKDGPLSVSEAAFARQMAFLADNGYHAIGLGELLDFLNYRRALPKKSVVITIDDGYRSAYDIAYPILRRHGFTAALFVYTDFIGTGAKAMTWQQLGEMKANGFEVGSHTVTHCDLSKKSAGEKDKAYRERVKQELLESKQVLDERLGQDTVALAFPYGNADPEILQLCQSLGYRLGVTVRPGANPFFADPLNLRREQIVADNGPAFQERLKHFEPASLE
ncbi:MAG: polysaccharide deacetylase family protein [Deltaproteobacteria bacterium]|nr:polysaccharide deacetylase family protein [Deltaproteobacteria bacterium]